MTLTDSERWFDRYVREHGHNPGEPEPALGGPTNPDRLIAWNDVQVICEIKEFTTDRIERRRDAETGELPRTFMMGDREVLSQVRRTVRDAADQLEPLADRGLPLVIVLANPHGQYLDLDWTSIVHALYGDATYTFAIDPETGGQASPVEFGAGEGGVFRTPRRAGETGLPYQHVSAVSVLHCGNCERDWADEASASLHEQHGVPKTWDEAAEAAARMTEVRKEATMAGSLPEGDYLYCGLS